MALTNMDKLKIAKTIMKTYRRNLLDLITGIRKGTKILRTLNCTYASTGKARQKELWEELLNKKYDGKDPIQYSSKWRQAVRAVQESGMKLNSEQQITIFLANYENKIKDWVKITQKVLCSHKQTLTEIIDDFVSEFCHKKGKKSNNLAHVSQKDSKHKIVKLKYLKNKPN
ncbi:hypothetical protein K445DRAFT_18303 [Daldinia sp. EC12]|nr:hypothetical protein K445DRAFT_18303 [Daldinia sp. EC12]